MACSDNKEDRQPDEAGCNRLDAKERGGFAESPERTHEKLLDCFKDFAHGKNREKRNCSRAKSFG